MTLEPGACIEDVDLDSALIFYKMVNYCIFSLVGRILLTMIALRRDYCCSWWLLRTF